MTEKPRDWDREMAEIDKVIAKGGGVGPAPVPAPRAAGAAPAPGGTGLAVSRKQALTTWIRALLGILLVGGILQWPYAHRCGLGLVLYLGASGTVVVAGLWTMIVSWRRRQGWAHTAGLLTLLAGLGLVAMAVLPRLGYARVTLPWLCE
ncbi:MAG TPA: hypothetical protein VFO06_06635 [Gemmatimonadales bacterium]|nr:hypothetical protein [Gemmatimonadales bacterium]